MLKYKCKNCLKMVEVLNFDAIVKNQKLCIMCLAKKDERLKVNICAECGEMFSGFTNKKYCSIKCRSKYHNDKRRDEK